MTVAFLADECFSGPLMRAMRADDVPGATDEQVLALAFAQNRIMLTEDSDFGDLAVRLGLRTHGVVRVVAKSLAKPHQPVRLIKALTELGEKVRGAMVTIEPNRTRVRPLPPGRG